MGASSEASVAQGMGRRVFLGISLGWLCAWLGGAAAQGVPQRRRPPAECREGTLLDEDIAKKFLERGRQTLARWQELGTPERRAADLVDVINLALGLAGIPQVRLPVINSLAPPLWIEFRSAFWNHAFDPEPLRHAPLTREQGLRLLALVYHEARHAEQFWLMARWRVREGTRQLDRLLKEAGVQGNTARRALACPLPQHSPLVGEIKRWYADFHAQPRPSRFTKAWKKSAGQKPVDPWDEPEQRTPEQQKAVVADEARAMHVDAGRAQDLILSLGQHGAAP